MQDCAGLMKKLGLTCCLVDYELNRGKFCSKSSCVEWCYLGNCGVVGCWLCGVVVFSLWTTVSQKMTPKDVRKRVTVLMGNRHSPLHQTVTLMSCLA